MNHPMEQIANIQDPAQLSYIHAPEGGLAGCYQVQATDKVGNLSEKSVRVCIDNCSLYNLPNIFTPNEDGVNDLYHPVLPYYNIEKVDFKVFNRWGFPLFQTQNPSLDWDGTDSTTGKVVSSGTYFYTCTVYERRLTGVEDRHLSGFIQVQTYKKGETKE
jgi:gliding motility-associated-like protein